MRALTKSWHFELGSQKAIDLAVRPTGELVVNRKNFHNGSAYSLSLSLCRKPIRNRLVELIWAIERRSIGCATCLDLIDFVRFSLNGFNPLDWPKRRKREREREREKERPSWIMSAGLMTTNHSIEPYHFALFQHRFNPGPNRIERVSWLIHKQLFIV